MTVLSNINHVIRKNEEQNSIARPETAKTRGWIAPLAIIKVATVLTGTMVVATFAWIPLKLFAVNIIFSMGFTTLLSFANSINDGDYYWVGHDGEHQRYLPLPLAFIQAIFHGLDKQVFVSLVQSVCFVAAVYIGPFAPLEAGFLFLVIFGFNLGLLFKSAFQGDNVKKFDPDEFEGRVIVPKKGYHPVNLSAVRSYGEGKSTHDRRLSYAKAKAVDEAWRKNGIAWIMPTTSIIFALRILGTVAAVA